MTLTDRRPRVVIEGGVVTLEHHDNSLSVAIFASETRDGGIYFEISAVNGSFASPSLPRKRGLTGIASYVPDEDE
jgi:hypothetical protein